jgi:hypothetical protein
VQKLNMKSILQIWVLFCFGAAAIGMILQWRVMLSMLVFMTTTIALAFLFTESWSALVKAGQKIRNWFTNKK